ncbi:MAG: hypothetical protein WB660_02150 [Candidatus Sulfotelmatobacter sp.]
MNLKRWLCSLLLAVVSVAPDFVFAGTNDAADAKNSSPPNTANTANAAEPAAAAKPNPSSSLTPIPGNANVTALLGVLVMKGVLAPAEANAIQNAAPEVEFQLLIDALNRKGVLSAGDLSAATNSAAQPSVPVAAPVAIRETVSASIASPDAESSPQAGHPTPAIQGTQPPPSPSVVPAIAPLRVLPVDPPKKEGLNAAFKMGPVKMTPYGFIKATAAHDTSSPNGDDFPFVGLFLTTPQTFDTGPTKDPEFHLKARSTRLGANIEWPDISSKIVLTGRVEGDYEGNFSEVDNRDVSSIRSNAFQLRLAWARLDYAASDNTDIYFEGGQDWTLFGSSALPNILETTFLEAFYGAVWERSPQFQFGLVQKLSPWHNLKFSPTFALMMPSSGQILKLGSVGLAGQLGEGEREGADSGRPELEGRVAFQFQLDNAPGVAPAQILVSGFDSRRTSLVPNTSYCTNVLTCGAGLTPANYVAAFPNGFSASSSEYGEQIAVQLPTRWFTLVASAYQGGDLRFFFGGQVNSFATDTAGLTNIVGGANSTFTGYNAGFSTLDGGPLAAAGGAVLGTNAAGQVVVAPQKPVRSFGGFVNLGLPLSRWFNANPKGHNTGWQLYFNMGKDQVNNRDLNNPGFTANANTLSPLPLSMGKMFAATMYYKLNPYVTFGIEQSVYATRLEDGLTLYNIAGQPSNEWQDHRTEFGPIFTF